jgi:hypothetical protein
MGTEPHRLVFIDETGTNTKMTRAKIAGTRLYGVGASCAMSRWLLSSDQSDAGIGCRQWSTFCRT